MRVLIDTHALLWWLQEHPSLSNKAHKAISSTENQVSVSTATVWELAIKNNSGKLEISGLLDDFESKLSEEGMLVLQISLDHALRAGALPLHHKDPFDRMLVAQAQAEGFSLISNDTVFDRYGLRRIW